MKFKNRFMIMILILSLISSAYSQDSDPAEEVTPSADYKSYQGAVEANEMPKWLKDVEGILGPVQLVMPTVKIMLDAYLVDVGTSYPDCTLRSLYIGTSTAVSYAAMAARLANMTLNILNTVKILDEMEKMVNSAKDSDTKKIDPKDFYELLISEYEEMERYSDLDLKADIFDLSSSSADLGLAIGEAFGGPICLIGANSKVSPLTAPL